MGRSPSLFNGIVHVGPKMAAFLRTLCPRKVICPTSARREFLSTIARKNISVFHK
jgi:hypothetical protein